MYSVILRISISLKHNSHANIDVYTYKQVLICLHYTHSYCILTCLQLNRSSSNESFNTRERFSESERQTDRQRQRERETERDSEIGWVGLETRRGVVWGCGGVVVRQETF